MENTELQLLITQLQGRVSVLEAQNADLQTTVGLLADKALIKATADGGVIRFHAFKGGCHEIALLPSEPMFSEQ